MRAIGIIIIITYTNLWVADRYKWDNLMVLSWWRPPAAQNLAYPRQKGRSDSENIGRMGHPSQPNTKNTRILPPHFIGDFSV